MDLETLKKVWTSAERALKENKVVPECTTYKKLAEP